MAYQTVPTFSDGSILSASDLNILADNTEFLHGLVSGINVPFTKFVYDSITFDETRSEWEMIHTARYLHYKLSLIGSEDLETLSIVVNGTTKLIDGTTRSPTYTYSGYLDTTVDPGTLTTGSPYDIYFTGTFSAATNNLLVVDYLRENDSTTL